MLELKLPFFGKRGTIKSIKENESVYVVTRHGISEQHIVPKKKKNLDGLYNNYYEDTKEYLETSYDKYKNYKQILADRKKHGKLKSKVNAKAVKIGILIAGVTTGLSAMGMMALISTTSILLYLDMSALALSLVTLSALTNTLANHLKDKKKENFIKEYNKYEQELNNYNIEKSNKNITKPTRYKGISQEKTQELTLNKKKVLKKSEKVAA